MTLAKIYAEVHINAENRRSYDIWIDFKGSENAAPTVDHGQLRFHCPVEVDRKKLITMLKDVIAEAEKIGDVGRVVPPPAPPPAEESE